jgi:uracil-DNA glycosylase family 4|tara:strand:+ start:463 stop:1224 length:762 start_codon:yes stop_codon:yes gene_type:complete
MTGFIPPAPDCALCPRLVDLRQTCQQQHPSWHNAPVNSFGDITARILIIGLAPGLRGANRTGRPFTGDAAGGYLFAMLRRFGLATGEYHEDGDDDIRLVDVRITNAVRCLPPANKPVASEVNTCRPYLAAEIAAMPHLDTIVTLGRLAHDATLRGFGIRPASVPFGHGASQIITSQIITSQIITSPVITSPVIDSEGRTFRLVSSYHCSRYNTQTRRLTDEMFAEIFRMITTSDKTGPDKTGPDKTGQDNAAR